MLKYLKIRDFALIRELEIEFSNGLNLLTGETGSGKSILVDAVSLLVGGRSNQEMVRSGCSRSVIEGIFSNRPESLAAQALVNSGLASSDDGVLVRREISIGGRGRVFINNNPATISFLKSLGRHLADIHGQQEHQTLLQLQTHLEWLDRYGENKRSAADLMRSFEELQEISERLESMNLNEQQRLQRIDVLRFQIGEIEKSGIYIHEDEKLQKDRTILANREKIYALSDEAYGILYESEQAILVVAKRLLRILEDLEAIDLAWASHRDALQDSYYKLDDLSFAIRDYRSNIDFSPDRLNQIELRLAEIERLKEKYGKNIKDILGYAARCRKELDELTAYADVSSLLEQKLAEALRNYLALAEKTSAKRHEDALRLEKSLRREFSALSMEKMRLGVKFHPKEESEPERPIPPSCGPTGIDRVEFMVSPNMGERMKPLASIASGGELSRIMLAIRALCGSGESGRTLVFDEVDTGIGGRAAEAVGRRLKEISLTHQVFCVTHLPQIAAFAGHHFKVWKDAVGERTETFLKSMSYDGRIHELARMMDGEVHTETSRRHAREMLKRSST